MAHVSQKLSNALEGALAGGGDPATSPLYVFGPFLRLIIVAGVGQITFGASIWLVVLTVIVVSSMYRLVMIWVVDGTGGSGLSEEEFGGWAVKVNASITVIEYTLTFLVSMAALVTFIADRLPILNEAIFGIQYRTFVAIILSIVTGWLVNRGPRTAARAFGPATAGVLILLWVMMFATIARFGIQLPSFDLQAFHPDNIGITLGGYARILALMTGIEIFANLVAAYDGSPKERSRKAFGSLIIIMGTTSLTMLIVGPAIFSLADPMHEEVSVFTQTMDQLLPAPLALLGTFVGVAVLLSASAASAQGLQNLALGLRYRHYLPAFVGQRNQFDVADKPVWIEVGVVSLIFLLLGTNEETYLALYAAGVFILLSMTGWAATKRLLREIQQSRTVNTLLALIGTVTAAILTTGATLIIFGERFQEGAWTYLVMIPALYMVFTFFRNKLGEPTAEENRIARLVAEQRHIVIYQPDPPSDGTWADPNFKQIMIPLDGSAFAEQALSLAQSLASEFDASLTLISIESNNSSNADEHNNDRLQYLEQVATPLHTAGLKTNRIIEYGTTAHMLHHVAEQHNIDLILMSTHGRSGIKRLLFGSVADQIVQLTQIPLLLLRPSNNWRSRWTEFRHLLITLDGSANAETILDYAKLFAQRFQSQIILLSVPDQNQSEESLASIRHYLDGIKNHLAESNIEVQTRVTGQNAGHTIVQVSQDEEIDLIMLATHGRGGFDRLMLGSVADLVVRHTTCPILLVPARG